MQLKPPSLEPLDRPIGKSEQAQFLGGRWIHRQSVSIVGMAFGLAHFFGIAIFPDRAFLQEPVRRQPGARQNQRGPPRVNREHER